MRSKFDKQLLELNTEMIKMGAMIEDSIAKAVDALYNKDEVKAKAIMELRTITAALKMVTDMERIGDHAADISEMTIYMGKGERPISFEHINKMASETMLMLNWSIEAYIEKDIEKAKEVIAHDDVVDNLFNVVKSDIIQMIHEKPDDGEEATYLLMVAKYFERIGDHATNIAEWVIFSIKGMSVEG